MEVVEKVCMIKMVNPIIYCQFKLPPSTAFERRVGEAVVVLDAEIGGGVFGVFGVVDSAVNAGELLPHSSENSS